jgi:hypothetical protein
MIKNKKILIFFTVIAAGGYFIFNQIKKLKESKFKFSHFETKKLTFKEIDTNLFFSIFNNSNLKINILEQNYIIYFYNEKIGVIKKNQIVTLLPQKENNIFLNLNFNPKKLLKNLPETILTDKNNLLIKSKIKLKTLIFSFNIYFDFKTSLKDLIKLKN